MRDFFESVLGVLFVILISPVLPFYFGTLYFLIYLDMSKGSKFKLGDVVNLPNYDVEYVAIEKIRYSIVSLGKRRYNEFQYFVNDDWYSEASLKHYPSEDLTA